MALSIERFETYNLENPFPSASVNDRNLVLTAEEIIDLKDWLRAPVKFANVCGELAVRQLTQRQSVRDELAKDAVNPVLARQFMVRSGGIAARLARGLTTCLDLPEDMWIRMFFAPPSDFSHVLLTIDTDYSEHVKGGTVVNG